ncbi:MAG: uncharacterized protein A8A55_3694, partial [Amphiamblys sp. WSBS2006]
NPFFARSDEHQTELAMLGLWIQRRSELSQECMRVTKTGERSTPLAKTKETIDMVDATLWLGHGNQSPKLKQDSPVCKAAASCGQETLTAGRVHWLSNTL